MTKIAEDLTGKRFTRLTVTEFSNRSSSRVYYWKCLCDCGKTTIVSTGNLTSASIKSCGCLKRETDKTNRLKHGDSANGKSPEYHSWLNMKARCNNKKHPRWEDYGGRGIKVCHKWDDFSEFLEDMGRKPFPRATIERIDNSKGYEPGNCVWATYKTQGRNKRNNRILKYNGEALCITAWAEKLKLSRITIHSRLNKGWPISRVLSTQRYPK